MNERLLDVLKLLADKRMAQNLKQLSNADPTYKTKLLEVDKWEKEYFSLDLDESDRSIIDNLISARDEVEMEVVTLAYLSGMADCIQLLERMEMFEY